MKTQILHNPRCSKSRLALQALEEKDITIEVIEYLKEPVTVAQLTEIIDLLGIKPVELLRKNEAIYKEQFKGKELSDTEWIQAMIDFPKLMERPIVIKDGKAVVARPTEKIEELF